MKTRHPKIEDALTSIVRLGERLEGDGSHALERSTGDATWGYVLRWLGEELQRLVDDDVLMERYEEWEASCEDARWEPYDAGDEIAHALAEARKLK